MSPLAPEQPASAGVDRELSLHDLLSGIKRRRLLETLENVLETPFFILDMRGNCVLGEVNSEKTAKMPVYGELEAIGELHADAPMEKLKTAAEILQLLFYANSRYLMASALHVQTQYADFEELQRKHAALEQSEMRYKVLAESLERRVKQQVKTIQATQLKLFENEKLASVGRLAAGMAHEINNPLGFIRCNLSSGHSYLESLTVFDRLMQSPRITTEKLQQTWFDNNMRNMLDDLRDIFQESIDGVERIAAIIKDLKGFSRIDQPSVEQADVNEIIRQTSRLATPQLADDIKVIQQLDPNVPTIRCQADRLGEVFHHLLLNAAEAVGRGGKILIKTSLLKGRLSIEVKDSGSGIPESVLPHVFDAFYTTKEIGQGMGLGLTICHHVIRAHRGVIRIKSKPGLGTWVQVLLPLPNTAED